MLLPLTHERAWVRRQPVITYAIILICVVVFFQTSSAPGGAESDRRFAEAIELYVGHPSLEPDPRLITAGMRRQIESLAETATADSAAAGTQDDTVLDAEAEATLQAELDRRTSAWLESLDGHPLWRHGRVPARGGQGWLSHMFLHAGLLHLLGNLFFLYLTAPIVEDKWGRPVFLAFYLVCGVVAGTLFAGQVPELFRPLVGASGAIAGVMGAFLVLNGTTRILFLLWLVLPIGTFKAPAWIMLPLWFGAELLSALTQDSLAPGGGGGVAYWAHVWGFAAGVVGALFIRHSHRRDPTEGLRNETLEQAHQAIDRGERGVAWHLLADAVAHQPHDVDNVLAYWELGKDLDKPAAAATAMIHLIRHEHKRGELHFAVEHWYELRSTLPDRWLDPALELTLARALHQRDEWGTARTDLIAAAVDHLRPTTPTPVIEGLATLAAHEPRHLAVDLFARLRAHPGLPPASAAKIEQLSGALQ